MSGCVDIPCGRDSERAVAKKTTPAPQDRRPARGHSHPVPPGRRLGDGSAQWLVDQFPDLFVIVSEETYTGMFATDAELGILDWINTHVRDDHGPLDAVYRRSGWNPEEPSRPIRRVGPDRLTAVIRPGRTAWHIGPLVAERLASAEPLLRSAARYLDGREVLVDAVEGFGFSDVLEAAGLEPSRRLTRMSTPTASSLLTVPSLVAATGFEWG